MDNRKLEVLLAVIEDGSFSKASEHLNCTQSAVTQTINRLEDELGCKVLLRHHSGVRLTAKGERLLPHIRAAYDSLVNLEEHAAKVASEELTELKIGAFASVANTWLPNILRAYGEKHPEVTFDIKISTGDLKKQLESGNIDIAFGDSLRLEGTRFTPLMDDQYFAVMSKKDASRIKDAGLNKSISQEELANFPFIMASMNALDRILEVQPKKIVKIDSDDDRTLLNMVSNGLGVTAMPELSLTGVPGGIKVLPLTPRVSRTIGIGLTEQSSKAAQSFCKFVEKEF